MTGKRSIRVGASILSSDFGNLEQVARELDQSSIDFVHIDVMDGHFVPNITFGPQAVRAIRPFTKKPFDVHLMITNPTEHIDAFVEAGADEISLHVETETNFPKVFERLRQAGKKTSLAYNPDTPLDDVEEHLPYLDRILLMGVFPGFGGQELIKETLNRATTLRLLMAKSNRDLPVQIDGGVNTKTIKALVEAGADDIVVGNALYASGRTVEEGLAQLQAALQP